MSTGKEIAAYDYRDELGRALYQNVRYLPKDFRQRRPDSEGHWIWGLSAGEYAQGKDGDWYIPKDWTPADAPRRSFPEAERVLYRLPELCQANRADWCFYDEGEKDCDNVRALGLTATTAGSSNSWRPEFAELFYQRRACIIPDRDKAGMDLAQRVAADISGEATEVRILTLPAEVNGLKIKDVSDWIEANDTKTPEELRDMLLALADAAPKWMPTAAEQATDPEREQAAPIIRPELLSAAELMKKHPKEREPIIDGIIRRGEVAAVISGAKMNKSWTLLYLAVCVILGRDFLGFPTRAGRVLLLDYELHPSTLAKRLQAILTKMGLTPEEIGDRLAIQTLRGRRLDIDQLRTYFANLKPGDFDLIIIDPQYRIYPAEHFDENNNADMANFYGKLQAYAEGLDAALIVVHHLAKGNQADRAVTDLGSGGGSQSRAADAHLAIRPHAEDGAAVLEGRLRNFPPFAPVAMRWKYPLWELAPDLDPSDLHRPPRRGAKPKPEPKPPPPPAWDTPRFAAAFLADEAKPQAEIIALALAGGVPNDHQARVLLERAESMKLAHRWKRPRDKRTYFASKPPPMLTEGAE